MLRSKTLEIFIKRLTKIVYIVIYENTKDWFTCTKKCFYKIYSKFFGFAVITNKLRY